MRKFITILFAFIVLQAGIVAVGSGAVHAEEREAGLNYTGQRLCVVPNGGDAQGERVCGNIRKYDRSTFAGSEGRAGREYIEQDLSRCIKYLGWSKVDLSDGKRYVSMESIKSIEDRLPRHEFRFHIYKIIDSNKCGVGRLKYNR